MKKTVILCGLILSAFAPQFIHAELTDEENRKVCKSQWEPRIKKVSAKLKEEKGWDKGFPGRKEREDCIKKLEKLLPKLEEGYEYCNENEYKAASAAYHKEIYEYLELHLD